MRRREYLADRDAALWVGSVPMINALEKIDYSQTVFMSKQSAVYASNHGHLAASRHICQKSTTPASKR